jgi:AcrR family transcriptional regulator
MELKTNNTEQIILDVAEKLFIEKGYTGTKTTEIANEAGVNHALLHYYFRTKENLFNQIFEQKAVQLLGCFAITFDKDLSFFEKIKVGIETHFELLSKSPKLPLFILREIVTDNSRKVYILKNLLPVGKELYKKLKVAIRNEMQKGNIRPVKTTDLLLSIVSLNVFAFVAAQIFFDMDAEEDQGKIRFFLDERKRNNVELIINSLKP